MIESPLLRELEEQWRVRYAAQAKAEGILSGASEAICIVLTARFGELPEEVGAAILARRDRDELNRLIEAAASCASLDEFRAALS